MTKKVSTYIKKRKKLKKQNHPREIIGYFLQTNRELVRDEYGRIQNMYDRYIKGKAIEKKINTYDGTSTGAFFIDFTEFKPKAKKLTAHKTMQGIIKRAATYGVISKGIASSFKLGKITAPVVNGKIDVAGLEYEKLKVKPAKKSRKKPKGIADLAKEIHGFLESKGYTQLGPSGELKTAKQLMNANKLPLTLKKKLKRGTNTRESVFYKASKQSRLFTLSDKCWMQIDRHTKGRYSIDFICDLKKKHPNEYFHGRGMVFDATDKKVLIEMLNRMGIKPRKDFTSVVSTQYPSKSTKTKVTTIAFKGKKFSITGTINGFTRNAFIRMAEKLGGKFQNHISKDLDMLIVGTKPGKTKVEKAKKYGFKIFKVNDSLIIMHSGK